ncbi:MAG: hypothetical protein WAM85_19675 [Terracidiphilus sp.]
MTTNLKEVPTVEEALREASKLKSMITEAVDDGVRLAMKTMKQGRYAAEDAIDETRQAVRQKPFEAMGIVFAAGVALGSLMVWLGSRRS